MSPLLEVSEVDAYYGQIQALRKVSLEVKTGEIVAVVGANGAGKTTLLRAISGMIPTGGGDVHFRGHSIAGLRPDQIVGLGVSHVPERRELFASMTVMENLELGAYHRRQRRARADARHDVARDSISRELGLVWELFPILRSRQKQVAGTLSGGEQQMLAIARGLMASPQMLLLDEPSLGLAPLLVQEVLRVVGQLRDMGRTVLLVEQNAAGALQVADRAYVMEVGRIVMSGSTVDLLQDDRVRRAYLGPNMGARIAPIRRPHKVKSLPSEIQTLRRETCPRRRVGKEEQAMERAVPLVPDLNYTLPDEFFQERLGISAGQLKAIQDRALPEALAYAHDHSPFYKKKLAQAGLTLDAIRGLQDLAKLPFTTTEEIRPDPARGYTTSQFMAVDQREVTAVHRSSGTTGAPKIFPYTGRDAARWAANVATVLWIAGLRKNDVLLGPGLSREFTGHGGGYLGALALGITYIPITIGPGVSETILAHLLGRIQVDGKEIVLDPLLHATAIHCLASFLPRLIEILDEFEVQPQDLALTKICCGAEPSSDAVRMRVAERLGIWPRDDYGLGEFYGPGVASECEAGGCLHVLSDTFIAEVVDPESGEPTPEGEMGELILTSLHKEALPLFRYRTGDRVMALPQNCPCCMAHMRIGRVTGRIRTDDIVIPGGIVINRTYLEEVLLPVDGVGYEYVVTVAEHPRRKGLQQFYIAVEADGDADLAEVIARRFRMEYKYTPVVHVLPMGAVPRAWGKAKRQCSPGEYRDLVGRFTEGDS
jgi:ABC-type branched-subunit amino acid transport system ATPase component/phenylacetate-coenzyme A ligase PaaK-like adenylate-forming protein